MSEPRWGSIAGWAQDFLRAARGRPLWARLALPIVVGRYAFRELLGLQDELERGGFSPYYDYDLKEMPYHGDKPSHKWWDARPPKPLEAPAAPDAPAPVTPPAPAAGLPRFNPAEIAELTNQHQAHTQHEVNAMSKLAILDQEFFALVGVALPQMPPEQAALFHAWNYRRQMVIEEVNEALAARKSDLERLYAEIGRHYGTP